MSGTLIALGSRRPQVDPTAWIAPTAILIGDVIVGAESSVWYGSVLRGDIERIVIGDGANVQDCCVLHTDPGAPLIVERDATTGHAAILHGCHVGEGALIGMGACVMSGAVIGADAVVGARALVPEGATIAPRTTVVGMPARSRGQAAAGLGRAISARYRERAQHHRDHAGQAT
ncbi:MAG TPA: gamma carbonic anhydrase family protein [Conexibacter sp.]|jgi:carbonic anhydrase/acetyltransferase-like protein (isoleucine patch superfamily)|nr:gamma carbonic anhydrase family protein [Conexibacter sp.]